MKSSEDTAFVRTNFVDLIKRRLFSFQNIPSFSAAESASRQQCSSTFYGLPLIGIDNNVIISIGLRFGGRKATSAHPGYTKSAPPNPTSRWYRTLKNVFSRFEHGQWPMKFRIQTSSPNYIAMPMICIVEPLRQASSPVKKTIRTFCSHKLVFLKSSCLALCDSQWPLVARTSDGPVVSVLFDRAVHMTCHLRTF